MMIPKDPPGRDQAIFEIISDDALSPKLVKLWTISTKMRFWLQTVKRLQADEIEKKVPMNEVPLTDEEKFGLSKEEVEQAELRKSDQEQERVRD